MRLNKAGLIFGESAPRGGLNVSKRLQILARLHEFKGKIAVDLGCGKGSYTLNLANWYESILAIDVLTDNLSMARERFQPNHSNRVHFVCAAGERVPLAAEVVDSVFMIEVLDHVPSLDACLSEVFRILKPNGILYVTVPNRMFPFETHPVRFLGQYRKPFWFPFLPWFKWVHENLATARVFSQKSLRDVGESAGLKLVSMTIAYPPLEHRGGPRLRSIMNWLETTRLRDFGSILAAVFCKTV